MGGTRGVGVDMAPRGLRGKLFLLFDKRRQPLVYMSLKLPFFGGVKDESTEGLFRQQTALHLTRSTYFHVPMKEGAQNLSDQSPKRLEKENLNDAALQFELSLALELRVVIWC